MSRIPTAALLLVVFGLVTSGEGGTTAIAENLGNDGLVARGGPGGRPGREHERRKGGRGESDTAPENTDEDSDAATPTQGDVELEQIEDERDRALTKIERAHASELARAKREAEAVGRLEEFEGTRAELEARRIERIIRVETNAASKRRTTFQRGRRGRWKASKVERELAKIEDQREHGLRTLEQKHRREMVKTRGQAEGTRVEAMRRRLRVKYQEQIARTEAQFGSRRAHVRRRAGGTGAERGHREEGSGGPDHPGQGRGDGENGSRGQGRGRGQ